MTILLFRARNRNQDTERYARDVIPLASILLAGMLSTAGCVDETQLPEAVLGTDTHADLHIQFGSPGSFDVLTWNIETFPKQPSQTPGIVARAIASLQPDILAVQEIWDHRYLEWVATQVGYEIQIASNAPDSGLAILYNPRTVLIAARATALFEGQDYDFGYRGPVVFDVVYHHRLIRIINLHYKCCGNGVIDEDWWDEEYRRLQSSILLKSFLDQEPDLPTLVVGDWNDAISDPPSSNVFQPFLDDSEKYRFADQEIASHLNQDQWSFPSYPSHIDHILINQPLFAESLESTPVVETILLEQALQDRSVSYSDVVSDHRPLGIRISF